MQSPTQQLLSEIEAFLERSGTQPSVFGWDAAKDPNLVSDLRGGRELRFPTLLRVKEYLQRADMGAEQ